MKKGNRTDLTEKIDEEQLWLAFKGGDEQAFAKIFRFHHKKLCNYGYKIIPDKDVVKDCVQDLFISLWNNHEKLEYTGAINFYLIKSLRGRLLRLLNKQKKVVMESLSSEDQGPEFLFFSVEDALIAEQSQHEQHEQLLKALNGLTKRQREVIYLKFFLDLDYQQIAEIMSLNYQVTRNYLYQAVKLLREKLDLVVCISVLFKLLS
jgi:RNA polymerase sigma factor (sigma-70 family)